MQQSARIGGRKNHGLYWSAHFEGELRGVWLNGLDVERGVAVEDRDEDATGEEKDRFDEALLCSCHRDVSRFFVTGFLRTGGPNRPLLRF